MGKTSRRKGVAFQSRVARWLREKLQLGNYWSTQGMETARGNIGDVRLDDNGTPEDHGLLIQTKKGKVPSPWRAMEEAIEAAEGTNCTPVAVVHRDRGHPKGTGSERLVIMRPEDWARREMAFLFSTPDPRESIEPDDLDY